MQTNRANWYDYPEYYDIAFGWDTQAELKFLERIFRRYAGRRIQRVFEPFCGTGRTTLPLARRGYQVSGLDINAAAIAFARRRAARLRMDVQLAVGDVCDWSAPEAVDAIVALIDSFRHLVRPQQVRRAVQAFERGLNPGGLLILGVCLGHPDDIPAESLWVMRRDGTVVETLISKRRATSPRGTMPVRHELRVTARDGKRLRIVCDGVMRIYTRDSLARTVCAGGRFSLRALFPWRNLARPVNLLDNQHAPEPVGNVVAVFVREGECPSCAKPPRIGLREAAGPRGVALRSARRAYLK
jgi:SAM-dependent methyltransferase